MKLPTPRQDERVVFLGKSGSGKTTLARSLLLAQRNVIVVNTKANEDWTRGFEQVRGNKVYRVREGRFCWTPDDEWLDDMRAKDRFFKWLYKAGNRTCYIDEINDIAPSVQRFPRYFHTCVSRGRSAGVGIWGGTQRPSGVPLWTISEANYVYTFKLLLAMDQQRVNQICEQEVPWSLLATHDFMLRDRTGLHGPLSL